MIIIMKQIELIKLCLMRMYCVGEITRSAIVISVITYEELFELGQVVL